VRKTKSNVGRNRLPNIFLEKLKYVKTWVGIVGGPVKNRAHTQVISIMLLFMFF
jgi:hypothetical protein